MNLLQDFIPSGRKNRPGIKMTPKYITIHDTANNSIGAGAIMHARYLKGQEAENRPASWHVTVDDKWVIQHVPFDEVTWHAGDGGNGPGNTSSIAIEICENPDSNREKAEVNAAKLVSDLLREFKLPISAVVQHNKWSGKNCPHIIRERQNGWEDFIRRVEDSMKAFRDVPDNHWAANVIKDVKEAGLMSGYPDGTFKPDQFVTRAELAAVVAKIIRLP